MLKIKDNVDLKELEMLGFRVSQHIGYYEYCCNDRTCLTIDLEDGKIELTSDLCGGEFCKQLNIVFDLIQAGLVEKVSDK